MQQLLLSSGDVARELGISAGWLRKLERDGKIPRAKRMLNNRRVYTPEDVTNIIGILVPDSEKQSN
jgi:DNA-binding transcriptional MerR regulator